MRYGVLIMSQVFRQGVSRAQAWSLFLGGVLKNVLSSTWANKKEVLCMVLRMGKKDILRL